MIEARNPPGGGSGPSVKKLDSLELYECANLGIDVAKWLKGRVGEVICTESAIDREGEFSDCD